MLSRLNIRNAQLMPIVNYGVQCMSSTPATTPCPQSPQSPQSPQKRRPQRLIYPNPVRLGIFPDEWFTYFYPKTGVTGPYVFGVGFISYLCSKEYFVLEHEFYNGVSLVILLTIMVKKLGPAYAAFIDKKIDEYDQDWKDFRAQELKDYKDEIDEAKRIQWSAQGQTLLFDAKRINVKMQLEAAYRERLITVYSEVKKRLDYQTQILAIERTLAQKHMIQWIIDNVVKAITPEQQKASLQQCIRDLQVLATRS